MRNARYASARRSCSAHTAIQRNQQAVSFNTLLGQKAANDFSRFGLYRQRYLFHAVMDADGPERHHKIFSSVQASLTPSHLLLLPVDERPLRAHQQSEHKGPQGRLHVNNEVIVLASQAQPEIQKMPETFLRNDLSNTSTLSARCVPRMSGSTSGVTTTVTCAAGNFFFKAVRAGSAWRKSPIAPGLKNRIF